MPDSAELQEGFAGSLPRLYERLGRLPGYTWDESAEPFHSSYDNWHVFGFKHLQDVSTPSASSPEAIKAAPLRASPITDLRPPITTANSDGAESDVLTETNTTYQPVVARISTHVLRLEREYQLAKALTQTVDPECLHLVRPVELMRLPPKPGDPGPLVVSIFESPGPNYLRDLVQFGPAYYSGRSSAYYSETRENARPVADQIPLPLFMDFAVAATECLEILHHSQGVVHGELRADAFHFNPDNGAVKLINFGSGPRSFENGLSSVRWSSLSKEVGFKDKLQFLAPEQTGRIPTKPDSRTDIYSSLGVLFYTMLTREPAFDGQSPMDVIQAVLSKRIPSASSRRFDVPDLLSNIISKMTHKQMDDRYHSTSGLKSDLVELRRMLNEADAESLKKFTLGTRDVSSTFMLPASMIGRREEHAKLVQVIEQVSKRHQHAVSKVNTGSLKGIYSMSSGSSFSESYLDSFDSGQLEDDGTSNDTESRKGHAPESEDGEEPRVVPTVQVEDGAIKSTSLDSKISGASSRHSIADNLDPEPSRSAESAVLSSSRRHNSHRSRRRARCEVISVSGAAGLGKSCLVQSVQVDARRHGYFATAKFDQAKKAPFEPVLKLMSSLFRQIFSESDVSTDFHNRLREYVKPIWSALHVMLDLPEFLLRGSSDPKKPLPIARNSDNSINTGSSSGSNIANGVEESLSGIARLDISSSGSSVASTNSQTSGHATRFLRGGSSSRSMRFVETFLDVLRMLTRQKFICLCLDDLQFADEESLELITAVVAAKIRLLLIVTYRPEEIFPEKVKSVLESEHAHMTKIELKPMSEEDIVTYISTTLSRRPQEILPLAMVVQEKSMGNVFFIREMLDTCYRKNCIWFDWKATRWDFDLDRIFTNFQTENYGQEASNDFTLQRLKELPQASRTILAWGSLLGQTFSFSLVQKLMSGEFEYDSGKNSSSSDSGKEGNTPEPMESPGSKDGDLYFQSEDDVLKGLQAALEAYVIIPADDDLFRFAHDRLVEAAGNLRERSKLEKMHFMIAQTLMKYSNLDERSLYSRSSHVCASVDLIRERVFDRYPYRDLLLQGALKASESGARSTALGLLQNCITLLQDDPWDENSRDCYYEETLQLHIRTAECYWFQNQPDKALELLEIIFKKAKNPVDAAPAWILQSRLFAQRGDTHAAYQALKKCSSTLGFQVRDVTWKDCDKTFEELSKRILAFDRDKLMEMSMTDNRMLTATGAVLIEIVSAAFWTDALLFYEMAMQMVSYHLENGAYSQVGLGYAHLATIAVARFSNIRLGMYLGDIGKELIYKFQDTYAVGRGLTIHSLFVAHLQEHVRATLPALERAMVAITAAGDRNLALLNLGSAAVCKLYASEDMVELEDFCVYGPEDIKDWEDDLRGGTIIVAVRQVARALQGKTNFLSAAEVMSDQYHNSQQYLEVLRTRSSDAGRPLDLYHTLAMAPLFLFGHYEKAIECGNRCLASIDELWSIRNAPFMLFYLALSLMGLARKNPSLSNIEETLTTAQQYLDKIQEWQAVNDVNYGMWTLLLKAEMEDLRGHCGTALRTYEDALDHCQEHEFILEEAMCLELMAESILRQGAKRTARILFGDAIAAYNRISAFAKSRHIDKRNESLLKSAKNQRTAEAGCQTEIVGEISLNQQYQPEAEEPERALTRTFSINGTQDRTQAWITPANANAVGSVEESKNSSPGLAGLGLDMIDLTSILTSSQVISSELQVDRLLAKMTEIILDSAGGQADFAAIVVEDEQAGWSVAASGDPENGVTAFQSGLPLSEVENQVSKQVILYSLRFRDTVFLHNLLEDERFANVSDSYLAKNPAGKAVIALPIVHGGDTLLGMLYLEGQPSSFTDRNLTVLQLLTNQMGISIANALLFKRVQKVSQSNVSMIESQKRALAHAREAEKKAKLAEAEAMRNVRLKEEAAKAKSMFLANVSHELRTPLNGVIGMSELLKGTKMTKEQMDYADSIRVCADTLLTVINDILDFSKLEAGKMQMFSVPLNLHETVTEVVRALAFTNLEKGLQTIEKLRLDKDLLVMGDPVRLHQIFMNLLSNSYKFTQKGSVTVEATPDVETEESIQVTFSVADTGIGITEEQLKRLFLPFSQADSSTARSYGGSGLGLSICKAIIENVLSGKIWLKSEPGVGTTVYFTLKFPKAPKDAEAPMGKLDGKERNDPDPMAIYSPPKASSPPPMKPDTELIDLSRVPRDKLRICIAEDNPINQRIAMSFVAKLGFKADAYSDGRQTVDALRKKASEGNPYHLVLMDVQMPVLDGYNATQEIRKDPNPTVRSVLVIAMTASAIRGDREKCIDAGMNNYLAKPVRADVLKKMLEDYLEQPNRTIPDLQRQADGVAKDVLEAIEKANHHGRNGRKGS